MDLELIRVAVVPVLLAVVPGLIRLITGRAQGRIGVIERENELLRDFKGSNSSRQLLEATLDRHVRDHNWATLRRIDGANLAAAVAILIPLAILDAWLIRSAFDASGWWQVGALVGVVLVSLLLAGFSTAAGKGLFREPKENAEESAN